MSDTEIKYLGELQRLKFRPGDRFVLTVPGHLPRESYRRIRDVWTEFFGKDIPLLILEPGMKLGVVSEAEG